MMARPGGRLILTLAPLVALLGLLCVLAPAAADAQSAPPLAPVFRVGAAARSVAPPSAADRTHVGGYGDCEGCAQAGGTATIRPHDAYSVQAMYIEAPDRHSADVLVSVPAEGMFAGYQEGADLGITPLRQAIAAEVARALPAGASVDQAHVIVSTIHCHACATLVGIWGPTNVAYLRYVQRQALAAVAAAQARAAPAHLTYATADFGYANDVTVGQANANEGWPIDGQLSVLQARAVTDGKPIATYMDVPVHGNIAYGPGLPEMDSEHFGAAAAWLQAHGQGVAVVAAGTLGDQTSPMQGDNTRLKGDPRPSPSDGKGYPRSYDVIDRLGALSAATAVEALAHHGHVVTDPTLGGAESYQLVPADNPVVLALLYSDPLDRASGTDAVKRLSGDYGADRAFTPPYAIGNAIGVWFTVLRVGPVAIASEPGEAFPHVSFAIRQAISGARAVFTVGNAQDQLGYYYEAWAYPGTFYYSADHYLFNVGKTLAEQNIQGDTLVARKLGFAVTPTVSSLTDAARNDYTRFFFNAGIQTWVYPQGPNDLLSRHRGNGIPLAIGVYYHQARGNELIPGIQTGEKPTGAPVLRVDGRPLPTTTAEIQYVTHVFPCAGNYTVTATLPGTSASWRTVVHVRSRDDVTDTAFYPANTGPHPLALQNLHDFRAGACVRSGALRRHGRARHGRGGRGAHGRGRHHGRRRPVHPRFTG